MDFRKGWLPHGYLRPQDGVLLIRSRGVISPGREMGDLILIGRCRGQECCRDQCNWKGQGCVSAWLSPRHGRSHPALPRNLPAPVLQGSHIAGTKRGRSPTEILSFCLKQKQQTPPTLLHYCCPHLLQHLYSGLIIYAEHCRLAPSAGKNSILSVTLLSLVAGEPCQAVLELPWASGSWPKGLVVWHETRKSVAGRCRKKCRWLLMGVVGRFLSRAGQCTKQCK